MYCISSRLLLMVFCLNVSFSPDRFCFGDSNGSTSRTTNAHSGAECLFITLCSLGKAPSRYSDLVKKLGEPTESGYSLHELQEMARYFGCYAKSIRTSDKNFLNQLGKEVEVIFHLEPGHYVVIMFRFA